MMEGAITLGLNIERYCDEITSRLRAAERLVADQIVIGDILVVNVSWDGVDDSDLRRRRHNSMYHVAYSIAIGFDVSDILYMKNITRSFENWERDVAEDICNVLPKYLEKASNVSRETIGGEN